MGEKDPPILPTHFLQIHLCSCDVTTFMLETTIIEINMLFASVCKFTPEVILIVVANGCMTVCHCNNLGLIASICCFFFGI